MDPKRRRAEGRERLRRPRHAAGRWSVLREANSRQRIANSEQRTRSGSELSAGEKYEVRSGDLANSSERPDFTKSPNHQIRLEQVARQLLRRYGVVFRDLLARESLTLPWRDLLVQYRRLELKGEIRGGRFVSGFTGEQFALPEAVEALRALRKQGASQSSQEVRLSACDPLNLAGIILPGPRVPAVPTNFIVVRDGLVVQRVEARETITLEARGRARPAF
jgi:ATP-dependent Lhr-like helicase